MLGWLKRLFSHTAEAPPRAEPRFPPAGLDRPDPPDTIVTAERIEVLAQAVEPERLADPPRSHSRGVAAFGASIDDDVYGLTFTIEYGAADGAVSRRRIMLRSISQRPEGDIYLQALCFERNALRSFRLDRILRVIDGDGQVYDDPTAFLQEELRVQLPHAVEAAAEAPQSGLRRVAAAPAVAAEPPGHAQRRCARDGLRVLVALARSDGMLHPAEVDVVVEYIEATCRGVGVACSEEDRAALASYLRRQRPGLDVLESCLDKLDEASPEERRLLLEFADRVIDADGHRHEAEHQMIAQIRAAIP